MTRQERNQAFIQGFKELLNENDAKMICCLGLDKNGKTLAVLDLDNTVHEILKTIRQFVEGLDNLKQEPQ